MIDDKKWNDNLCMVCLEQEVEDGLDICSNCLDLYYRRIIIYTTDSCPKCKILKKIMDERQIDYTECDDIIIMTEKGFSSVPQLEIRKLTGNEVMDFQEAFKWIKLQGEPK